MVYDLIEIDAKPTPKQFWHTVLSQLASYKPTLLRVDKPRHTTLDGRSVYCFIVQWRSGNKARIVNTVWRIIVTVFDTEIFDDNLLSENEGLTAENDLPRREITLLKEKVDLLIRRIFGVKSEKLDAAQLELLLNT